MLKICNVCTKKILSHCCHLYCSYCQNPYHLNCLNNIKRNDPIYIDRNVNNWLCTMCIEDNLPFMNIVDDEEYLCAIHENVYQLGDARIEELNNNSFLLNELTEIDDIDLNDPLIENDPDIHYYHTDCALSKPSKYCNVRLFSDIYETQPNQFCTNLSLFHLNIRSIPQNLSKLTAYLSLLPIEFSIIGISESWLSECTRDCYQILGYNSEHLCRQSKRGGGVSIFIKDSIKYKRRNDLDIINESIEAIFIEIPKDEFNTRKNLIIAVIYRPPNSNLQNFMDAMKNSMNILKSSKFLNFFLGDYNLDLLSYSLHNPTADFIDMMYANSFIPLINKPTRVTRQSLTLIDNIYTNCTNINIERGIFYTDISDHLPIFCIVSSTKHEKIKSEFIYKRIYSTKNFNRYKEMITNEDWIQQVLTTNNPQQAFSAFHSSLCKFHNTCFPLQKVKLGYKTRKSWLSQELKNMIKVKNKLYYQSIRHPEKEQIYKRFRNSVNKKIHEAERNHYQQLILKNKNNLSKSWKIIKEVINRNKKSNPLPESFLINDKEIGNKQEIADAFNKFYVNIGPNLCKSNITSNSSPMQYMNDINPNEILLNPVTDKEVKDICFSLNSCSPGWDCLSTKIIQTNFDILIRPLKHALNLSLEKGIFPKELKVAKVIPLHKGNEKNIVSNYRPISLLPILSKVYEKVMYDRLIAFIDVHKLLYELQFGFRKDHSTCSALIVLMDKITHELELGNYVLGVFLDYSKAFDCINHSILLQKLYHYGIRGSALEWFKSYLTDRKQFVYFNNTKSNYRDVTCGVPQGSILGPILFLIYINDIVNVSRLLFPILFADDSNVFYAGKDPDEMIKTMNNELEKLLVWLKANKLCLNVKKTHYMFFSPPRKCVNSSTKLIIEGEIINQVSETKFLGVIVDSKLSWTNHINYISKKISKGIGILNKARKYLPRSCLTTLYYSFVYPYLNYCLEVWGKSTENVMSKIFKLQKRAVRVISNEVWRAHSEPLFDKLKILPIKKIYIYKIGTLMYKYHKGLLPTIFNNVFKHTAQVHNYNTRQVYHVPLITRSKRQRTAAYQGPIIGNYFAQRINPNCTLNTYKKNLRTYLRLNNVDL